VSGTAAVLRDTGGQAEHTEPVDWVHPWVTAQSAARADVLTETQALVVMGTLLIGEVGTEATLPGMLLAPRNWLEAHQSTPGVSTWAYSVEDEATAHQ
jgi:hypothetical protein